MDRSHLKKLKLPHSPGVYQFIGDRGKILYIGKATSLRDRVRSYFDTAVAQTRGTHIKNMVARAKRVKVFPTDSVLEALLFETELIKTHRPPSNTKEKDDKSWNHIIITDEDFPRVLVVRGKEISDTTVTQQYKIKRTFGPFPHGTALKEALRLIRKIFPFRDRCTLHAIKPCFNAQIGLCPGVCIGAQTKQEYRATIRNIILFCEGKKKRLVLTLRREMNRAAKNFEFEKAGRIKKTIFALEHIQDIALLKRTQQKVDARIEAYDIAHISGTAMSGAMVVVEDGAPNKNEYRKFTIKTVAGSNDTAALKEVLLRRFRHREWPYPQLIVIDGGVAQKNTAERTLKELGLTIPIVSVVKDDRHRPRAILGIASIKHSTSDVENAILLANSEAHRFALGHHKKLRKNI